MENNTIQENAIMPLSKSGTLPLTLQIEKEGVKGLKKGFRRQSKKSLYALILLEML